MTFIKEVEYNEATQNAIFAKLSGWSVWEVQLINNFYDGRYYSYGVRNYQVVAASANQAYEVVLANADAIFNELLSTTWQKRKILSELHALPIDRDHIGTIEKCTETCRRSTLYPKPMHTPAGVKCFQLTNGAIVGYD
jgi:hypothetical protein